MKQTVMTSVYGVTYVGAREQIKRRLIERGQITDDRLLFSASCYAAKVDARCLIKIDVFRYMSYSEMSSRNHSICRFVPEINSEF